MPKIEHFGVLIVGVIILALMVTTLFILVKAFRSGSARLEWRSLERRSCF